MLTYRKKVIDHLNRCYCGTVLEHLEDGIHLLFSEEAIGGRCIEYFGKDFNQKRVVWEHGGGTMSMIPIPDNPRAFLAIQNFFPGFEAQESKIVWCELNEQNIWECNDYVKVPYLHRFDLLKVENELYIIGGVLCETKEFREDWSSPGKIIYAKFTCDKNKEPVFKAFNEPLYKNHGYTKVIHKGQEQSYFACENGVYLVTGKAGKLTLKKVLDTATSDIALSDLDKDGTLEMLTISPFHGDMLKLYKQDDKGEYREVFTYDKKLKFAHAICSGTAYDMPVLLFGNRREETVLTMIYYNQIKQEFETEMVDEGGGYANVMLFEMDGKPIILSCNHSINEAAIYYIEQGD